MKNLHYGGKFFKQIVDAEADIVMNTRGMHVEIDGNLLKKSQIDIFACEPEGDVRIITEYTTEELKGIIGYFEKEYNENAVGEVIDSILGPVKEGTLEHALNTGAVSKDTRGNYFIKLPEFANYNRKHLALRELIRRRDYAMGINKIPNLSGAIKDF